MDSKIKAYAILIIEALLIILFILLLCVAFMGPLSEKDLIIVVSLTTMIVLPTFIYATWYLRKNFGPEWYRIKVEIPPEVRKSPRVRAFKYAGLIVLIIGFAIAIWFKDPMLLLFFAATSCLIIYQGAKEETKFFPPALRRHREFGYMMVRILWLALLLGFINWLLIMLLRR